MNRPLARLQAVLFLGAISIPWFFLATGRLGGGVAKEMRKAQPRPQVSAELSSVISYPRRFSRWYSNQFAFRKSLVHLHNVLKWVGLHTAPTDKIAHGRDGWLFYADSQTLTQVRGALPLTDDEIDLWVEMLEQRQAWLRERGIEYFLAVAPAKGRVYPEFLPEGFESIGPSRQDQVLAALSERSDIRFIDLGPAMIDERKNDREGDLTYYKYGTHWTERGALRGWREIVARVPEVFRDSPPSVDELERRIIEGSQGDTWSERLYLEEYLVQQDWGLGLPEEPPSEPRSEGRFAKRFEGPDGLPRVMMFHDSFGRALRTLLARSCSELSTFWTNGWELALIEHDKPDLVIDLFIERKFVTLDPTATPFSTQDWLRNEYEQRDVRLWSMDSAELGEAQNSASEKRRTDRYRLARLERLTGDPGEDCCIAVEVESADGGVLELVQLEPGQRTRSSNERFGAARAYVKPGRHTVYLQQTIGAGTRDLWAASPHEGLVLLSAEARR